MRLYSYVSRASGLAHISKILNSAKRNNSLNGITGMLSYNKGYYFQVIEGRDDNVAALCDIIHKDSRHSDIQTILDISTEERYFPDWSMKLVPLLANNSVFQAFMMDMDFNIEALSPEKHALVEIFYQSPRYSYSSKLQAENWNLCEFSVDHWPDFSELPPTVELMSLCGSLFNNTLTYQQLSNDTHYGSENELRDTLRRLNRAKCLVTSKIERRTKTILQTVDHDPNELGFISKMKEFINVRLH